jgi:hypothetical protein
LDYKKVRENYLLKRIVEGSSNNHQSKNNIDELRKSEKEKK